MQAPCSVFAPSVLHTPAPRPHLRPLPPLHPPDWRPFSCTNLVDNALKHTPAGGPIDIAARLADPEIEYLGLYEIKDLSPTQEAIGDHANYHLGITRADRTKKLAFYTVDLLTDLLDTGALTPADEAATVAVTEGASPHPFHGVPPCVVPKVLCDS